MLLALGALGQRLPDPTAAGSAGCDLEPLDGDRPGTAPLVTQTDRPVALAPHVLAAPLYRGATITVGIAAGVAIIVVAISLTACYVLRANRAFDRRVDAILQRS